MHSVCVMGTCVHCIDFPPSSDEHGFTPLHYSCMYGHANIVEMFLQRGARADLINMGGDSLLHVASQHGKYDVMMKVGGVWIQ